jgi:hypothetical protein
MCVMTQENQFLMSNSAKILNFLPDLIISSINPLRIVNLDKKQLYLNICWHYSLPNKQHHAAFSFQNLIFTQFLVWGTTAPMQ